MTKLEQISDIRKCVYLIIGALGTTAGKAKNLEREHYSAGELDTINSALLAAVGRFRGGVFYQGKNADKAIADRFDRCREIEASAATVEQSQLAQIDSLIADAKATKKMFKDLALDIEQLKADHPQQYIDARYWAVTDALKEYCQVLPALRALRKDAEILNGITAADGEAGTQKALARFHKITESHITQTAKQDAKKQAAQAAKDRKYES